MTTPRSFYLFNGGREGNPVRDNCMKCAWKYPTNPHKNSFYCPNPSCRFPHVCIRPGRSYVALYLSDPTGRSTVCYNCDQTIEIPPISPEAIAVRKPNVAPPSFLCPNCLFVYRYYKPIFINYLTGLPRADPPPPAPITTTTTTTPTVVDNDDDESVGENDVDDDDDDEDLIPALGSFIDSLPTRLCNPKDDINESCSICTDDLFNKKRTTKNKKIINELPCGHYFHKDCIVEWLLRSNTCPLCRYQCPPADDEDQDDDEDDVSDEEEEEEESAATTGSGHSGDRRNWVDEDGDTLMVDAS